MVRVNGRVAIVGVALAVGSLLTAVPVGPAAANPAGTVTATVVEHTSPVGPSGHLLPGYQVNHNYRGATCKSHSDEVGDAYACHLKFGYDPCWVTAKHSYVVCLSEPYAHKVARLHVVRFVNKGGLGKPKPLPWGLLLANGKRTTLLPGSFGTAGGEQIHYTLDSRYQTVLAGPIDKSGPVWRIRLAKNNGRFQFKLAGWIDIDKAWIAEPSRLS